MSTTSLKQQWETLKEEQPQLRIRNAAQALNVSEAELLATKIGNGVTRLVNQPKEILQEIESLGKVMALTRNESCVHERKGNYLNPSIGKSPVGLFVGEDIDLRIFFMHWAFAFAVSEMARGKERLSLQFFAEDGMAIHKIYLTPQSNIESYKNLVEKYKAEEQSADLEIRPFSEEKNYKRDEEVDLAGFQKSWEELKDTHHFFGLLKKHNISRTQALKLAPSAYYADKIDKNNIVKMLEIVASKQVPIMVFVGNRGNIQIHTGDIKKTLWHQQWFNIMDPDFNLHLNMEKVENCWVVRKPTEDGIVTSIECFDDNDELIVQFFGKRKPGIPEIKEWQEVVAQLQQ
ncbi:hemin-degrading factor [Zunongwangia sp. SCSIO 43204]|uniref:hemin-degrading factor n=1 Tax=Zunongwangia sp. SCSIO 43204 TaxID=2779359 RepID=UPI001CA7E1FD|nr:ChuX/HutX family heme-like substrate-binding protein [Zunongwangia sp. SCSIO 43204]UAB84953.1 hemin-degrading factor [Zunongwangia sp. SCSIO 43204]